MFLLAKFFEKEEYLEQFLHGKLYLNNLQYFRESEKHPSRVDPYEGSIWLNAGIQLTSVYTGEKIIIPKRDLDDIQMYTNLTKHVNLFCMCKIYIPEHVKGGKQRISIPNEILVFGKYGVLINHFTEFTNRIKAAIIKNGHYKMGLGHVRYNDRSPEDPNSPKTLFHKREMYKYQNEYRIAVLTAPEKHDHLMLEIGDLGDIAIPFTLKRQG